MKNKIQFVLCLLMGLLFINGGLNKFFNYMPMPKDIPADAMKMFVAMMEITWLMPLLATFEIIGGLLFILPRTRALGAVILAPITAGIVAHHLTIMMGLPMALIIAAVHVWVIIDHKEKYLPMIHS